MTLYRVKWEFQIRSGQRLFAELLGFSTPWVDKVIAGLQNRANVSNITVQQAVEVRWREL